MSVQIGHRPIKEGFKPRKEVIEKYIWKEEEEARFVELLSSDSSKSELVRATEMLSEDVNESIVKFNNVILKAANNMCIKVKTGGARNSNNPWFDEECRACKKEARKALTKVNMAI